MSDSEDPEIENVGTLVPEKSRKLYKKIEAWCDEKIVRNVFENVIFAYFSELSTVFKPSTLWSQYSMLQTMLYLNKNVDIKKFMNVCLFLKQKSSGYRPKKSLVFTKEKYLHGF